MRRTIGTIVSLLILLNWWSTSNSLSAAPASTVFHSAADIASSLRGSVVGLTVRDTTNQPVATGSDVIVGPNRIITCWHIINGSADVTVNLADGCAVISPGAIAVDP
jgi:hypothetical protein